MDNDSATSELNPILDAALAYAARGWRVLPVYGVKPDGSCQCGNTAEHAVGKHPIGKAWQERASTAGADLYEWFGEPGHNLGIATGRESGIFVVDLDVSDTRNGVADLQQLIKDNGREWPLTRMHETPSGGAHLFFRYPDGVEITNSPGALKGTGIDIRGDGGQVVAPPSRTPRGVYSVARDAPVVDAPAWFLELLRKPTPAPHEPSTVARHESAPEGYVEAAIEKVVAELRSTPEGGRNDALNRAAFSLATMIPHGVIDETLVGAVLGPVAFDIGLELDEVQKTLASGIEAGIASPRPWPPEKRAEPYFIPFDSTATPEPGEWPRRSWDDFGNAQRLLDHFPERLRWVDQADRWAVWHGDRWSLDATKTAQAFAMTMLDRLPETEALSYSDEIITNDKGIELPSERERFLKWVRSQRFFGKTRAVLDTTKGLAGIAAQITDFDRDPFLLNLKNGVLDLETGTLLSHAPELMMMEQAGASYEEPDYSTFPGEVSSRLRAYHSCPRWLAFLEKMQPDHEVRAFLRRVIGYSLTGDISEQKMFLHLGEGSNGKSVFNEVCTALTGSYAQAVPRTTFIVTRNEAIPTDVARMAGKRFLQTSETGKGQTLDEEMVKSLTGGEMVTGRFMRQDFFDFTPTGKIHYFTNHFPRVSSAASLWRRLVIIPWRVTIADDDPERDHTLARKIIAEELDGVLAWALEGLREWQAVGLGIPSVVREAGKEYADEADDFAEFLDECVVTDLGVEFCPAARLYDAYTAWVFRGGRGVAMSVKAFSTALKERGFTALRRRTPEGNLRGFAGVTVRSSSISSGAEPEEGA